MKRKIIACVTAAAIAGTTIAVSASGESEKYPYDYTIGNILSDYQFFAAGDLSSPPHTVGAVAVGGTALLGSWGDGQIIPTYVHNIGSYSNNAGGSWVPEAYQNGTVYYGGAAETLSSGLESRDNYIKYDEYIDFTAAMSAVCAQSQALADAEDSYTVQESDIVFADNSWTISYVNADLSKSKNINIPYDILSQVDRINFVGADSIDELAKGGYTISFTGVGSNTVNLTSGYAGAGSGLVSLALNGGSDSNAGNLSNKFKDLTGGDQGGQINLTGMNLVLNFPDAENVDYQYAAGHVVAPKGNVSLSGGNSEGGVIAGGNISTIGEAHFYPYNAPGVRTAGGQADTTTTTTTEETTTTTEETTTTTEETTTTAEETTTTAESSASETTTMSAAVPSETTTTTTKATTTTTKTTTTAAGSSGSTSTTTSVPVSSETSSTTTTSATSFADPTSTVTTSDVVITTSEETTTTVPESEITTTEPDTSSYTSAETTTLTTTEPETDTETTTTTSESVTESETTTVSDSETTTTTTTSVSETDSSEPTTTTTTSSSQVGDAGGEKNTTTSSAAASSKAASSVSSVNTASSDNASTGMKDYAALSAAALLTGAAALYICGKKFGD